MSPSEPEPSDSAPTPKKLRQKVNRLAKDSSEKDLWDFDPGEKQPAPPVSPTEPPPSPPETEPLPKPRYKAPKSIERAPRPLPASQEDGEPVVRQSAVSNRSPKNSDPIRRSRPTDDIGELESSEDAWAEAPAAAVQTPSPSLVSPELEEPIEEPSSELEPREEVVSTEENEFVVTDSVQIDHRPLRERLGLSKLEKIGMGVLAAALLGTAIFLLTSTFGHISTQSDSAAKPSFPIKGALMRILNAGSYWREPVKTGPNAESVRRETKLIPVLTLELEGGPCAIRAIFRDDHGESVGDSVTRAASSGKLEIPATAGFEDIGAHAAYRTGETHPWKIEIFEAPSVDSSRQEFKKLLELPISPDRR